MAEKRVFGIGPNMQMAVSQFAECSNGRNWPNPVDLYLKKGLHGNCENFNFCQKKIPIFYQFNLSGNFRKFDRICGFRPFESVDQCFSAFIIFTL
jgi:hypothetical protein